MLEHLADAPARGCRAADEPLRVEGACKRGDPLVIGERLGAKTVVKLPLRQLHHQVLR
jgi:hypothetical protein